MLYFPPSWLYVILFQFPHDRSKWFFPSFSSITFQKFQGVSDLLTEVSSSQHHTKLCPKCNTLLLFSFNLSPTWWWKVPSSGWILLLSWQFWIEFNTYILHHVFVVLPKRLQYSIHILRMILIYHNVYWGLLQSIMKVIKLGTQDEWGTLHES